MSLAVCFLTRNEATSIGRAIASIAGVADEVLVADTGSTDGTADAAASAGAVVHHFAWTDDFAAGRNFVLARASAEWVLWLNADETLLAESVPTLKALTTADGVFGYFVNVRRVPPGDPSAAAVDTADLRLFRRRPDALFVGRLHPHFDPSFVESLKTEGQPVRPSDVVLLRHPHPAAGREDQERKLRFTLRLLDLELKDRPGQLHYMIEYGRTLLRLKNPKGHEVLAGAAAVVMQAKDAPAAPSAKVQVLLEYLLTNPVGGPGTRREATLLASRWFPTSPRLVFRLAEQAFLAGDAAGAARLLERLLEMGRTAAYDRSQPFDPGLVGDDARINLAACYRRLGRLDEAEACYRQLLASPHFASQAAQGLAAIGQLRATARPS